MVFSTLARASLGQDAPEFREVVAAIFGEHTDLSQIHVTYFKGDPHNKDEARWNGQRLSGNPGYYGKGPAPDQNHFICMGLLDPDIPGRSLANVIGHVAFWMDDVGTKVPQERVQEWCSSTGLYPTVVINTSPGNFSYVWALKEHVRADGRFDDQTVAAIRAKMKQDGWGDPATQEAARYMRSGFGVNGKAKYAAEDGSPFPVKVVTFNPDERVSLTNFANYMLGEGWRDDVSSGKYLTSAQLVSGQGSNERRAHMDMPIVKLAQAVGLDPQPSTRAGVIDCRCPNEAAHTGGDPTGYAIINDDMSFCNHASCQHLRSPDFLDMMKAKYDDQIEVGLMFGKLTETKGGVIDLSTGEVLPASGSAFHAKARFEGVEIDPEQQRALAALVPVEEPGVPEWVAEMNAKFAHVLALDRVVEVSRDGTTVGARHTLSAFKAYFDGKAQLQSGSGRAPQGLATAWLKSPDARRYERVGLWPVGAEPPGSLNLWQGFPKVTAWPQITTSTLPANSLDTVLAFIRDVIASGRIDVFEFVLNWLAWKLQNPLLAPGTAMALIGKQGTGKTTLTEMVIDMIGERYVVTASQERHMTGNFNAHFGGKVLAVFEEAFLGKDPKMAGPYKDLVTGARMHVESKGVDIRDEPNRLAVMLTSNDTSVVPLEPGDRRTTLIEVSDAKRLDNRYFAGLRAAWTHGGREAFIDFLLARDVSSFDPRIPLATEEKARALAEAGDVVTRFWADVLDKGVLPGAVGPHGAVHDWVKDEGFATNAEIYSAFEMFARGAGSARFLPSQAKVLARIAELCPNRKPGRPRVNGSQSGTRGFTYPPLVDCRAAFARAAGGGNG